MVLTNENKNNAELNNEKYWDLKLNILTTVSDYADEDDSNYGYDATPYIVLEELLKLELIDKNDILVDYGCGKGRLSFFFNNQIACEVIGIDHSKRMIKKANRNLENYISNRKTQNLKNHTNKKENQNNEKITFIHTKAEDYIPTDANRFYFFNPFSTKVFQKVLKRIKESQDKNPREILIFFYYSTIEYKLYLKTEPHLELIKSIEFDKKRIDDEATANLDIFRFK